MAKIQIAGQAVIVTSSISLEDIKLIKKYRPDALVLKGGEDGKKPIFAIGVGGGKINEFGVSFDKETRDDAKLATLTMVTDFDGDDIVEYVTDKIGGALINLNKLEETLPNVLAEIYDEKTAIQKSITIVQ